MTARWHWIVLLILYFVVAAILYSPSLGGPWQYDDYAQILDAKVLIGRSIPTLLGSLIRFTAWPDGWTGTRDFVRATFRLNFDWWGLHPAGYRWMNLGVHIVTAFLVAALIYLLYNSYEDYKNYNFYIPALAGLLFLVHPIQSQAVAYVAQRFASMATLFFVATIIFFLLYIRYNFYNNYKRYIFYGLSLLFALFAFNSKEISLTLPVALVLCTFCKIYNNYKNYPSTELRTSKNYKIYIFLLPFFLLALKIPLQTMSASLRGAGPESIQSVTKAALSMQQEKPLVARQEYFLTELNVVRTYLRLLVLPIGQTLDWDYPITHSLDLQTALSGLLHLTLVGGGVILLFWNKGKRLEGQAFQPLNLIGLGVLWFYLTIALESSVIPIPDVIYEHRVYLPFVGVAMAFSGILGIFYNVYNSYRHYKSYMFATTAIWLLLLSGATLRRAYVWGDEVLLWGDVYQKAPNKPRANKNYGVVLAARGQYQQGIARLKRAVELEPETADYWSNLGTAYLRSGDFQNSAPQFLKAFELAVGKSQKTGVPLGKTEAQYMNDYGVSLLQLGKAQESEDAFHKALEVEPTLYAAGLGLGAVKNVLGDTKGAILMFDDLVKKYPDQQDAYGNLATMLVKAKRYNDALATLLALKKLNPRFENIDNRIAIVQKALMDNKEVLSTMKREGVQ